MTKLQISGRWIGDDCEPFVIAEVGINHNGDLEKAFRMIRVAKESGADAVKFQTFRADELVGDASLLFTYQSQGKTVQEPMIDMFRRYELSDDQWTLIDQECRAAGITFLSTPQNVSDLGILLKLGISAIKVGSDDFTNIPLLKSYAKSGLPIIVSCGMANLDEVRQSLEALGALRGYPTVLLLCVSQYPTLPEDVNLRRLDTLKEHFPELILGFSDHTQGPLASSMAVGLGAKVFEKHFTLDRQWPGPDHWFSEDPAGLAEWVRSIREAHRILGDRTMKPTAKEEEMKRLARRSIAAIRDIHPGEVLSEENIGMRRPGNGMPPILFEEVLGCKAARLMRKGDLLQPSDYVSLEKHAH